MTCLNNNNFQNQKEKIITLAFLLYNPDYRLNFNFDFQLIPFITLFKFSKRCHNYMIIIRQFT